MTPNAIHCSTLADGNGGPQVLTTPSPNLAVGEVP
jgi:hypothetical protein